jgi:hypothetical protein
MNQRADIRCIDAAIPSANFISDISNAAMYVPGVNKVVTPPTAPILSDTLYKTNRHR